MICCYLLHTKRFTEADDSLRYYDQARTKDEKVGTIINSILKEVVKEPHSLWFINHTIIVKNLLSLSALYS